MNYESAKDPQYINAEKTCIKLTVKFEHLASAVTFIASSTDVELHGCELFKLAHSGQFGSVAEYTPPTADALKASLVSQLRASVTNVLEAQAKSMDFDSLAEALTYCDEPAVPLYQQQALALRAWRSVVWAWFEEIVLYEFDLSVISEVPKFKIS